MRITHINAEKLKKIEKNERIKTGKVENLEKEIEKFWKSLDGKGLFC